MKIILPFLFILFSTCVQAQNWAPVNTFSKYNYKLDTAGFITHTIWSDSTSTGSGVDTFYLNRIVKTNSACDSLIDLIENQGSLNNNYCTLCKAYKNQPQFLQKQIIRLPGGVYQFNDPMNFRINSLAHLGDTWLFNLTESATVIRETITTFSGVTDSIKLILSSIGDSIIISKEHGILLFPDFENAGTYYRLAGTENPNLGEIVPGFWQMYDYEIGGVICLSSSQLNFDSQVNTTKKSIITSKQVFGDSIKYGTVFHSHIYANGFGWFDTDSASGNENWTFIDSTNGLFDTYNNQLCSLPDGRYFYSRLYKSDGKYVKKIGIEQNPGFGIYFIESDSVENLLIPACDPQFESFFYKEGTGLKHYDFSCNFECGSTEDYDYLPQNSSDLSYCLSDFTSINEVEESQFAVFPNPARGKAELQFEKEYTGDLILLNQTGQAVFASPVQKQKKYILDISLFSTGIYTIELRNSDHTSFRKLVIAE